MGLIKTVTINGGVEVADAYHRINGAEIKIESTIRTELSSDGQTIENITVNSSEFEIQLLTYKDQSYRLQDEIEPASIHHRIMTIPLSALDNLTTVDENTIKTKIYEYLKTLDEFSEAADA